MSSVQCALTAVIAAAATYHHCLALVDHFRGREAWGVSQSAPDGRCHKPSGTERLTMSCWLICDATVGGWAAGPHAVPQGRLPAAVGRVLRLPFPPLHHLDLHPAQQ